MDGRAYSHLVLGVAAREPQSFNALGFLARHKQYPHVSGQESGAGADSQLSPKPLMSPRKSYQLLEEKCQY